MKRYERFKVLGMYLLPLLMILLLALIYSSRRETTPRAVDGVLDLSDWDFRQNGPVKLNGEWEFYWHQLLTPQDVQRGETRGDRHVSVPSVWNSDRHKDSRYPGQGFATYRLRVKINDPNALYSLKLGTISTSYRLIVNDQVLAASGIVGESPNKASPAFHPEIISFKADAEELDLLVQVANFTYARGGLWSPIILGLDDQILALREANRQREIFLLGALFIMALYHIAIFVLQKKYRFRAELYFVLMMLLFALRLLFGGEYLILRFFPSLSMRWLVFFEYTAIYWATPSLALFIQKLYPDECSPRVLHGLLTIAGVLTLITLLTPIGFYTRFTLWIQIISVVFCLYYLYAAWRAAARNRAGAALLFGVIIFACGAFILESLYHWQIFSSKFTEGVFPIVSLILIFAQSFILAQRSSTAFAEVESLSERLISLDKLKDDFIANTSHELRTPLHGMITITESILETSAAALPQEQRENLALVAASGKRLANLVNDILDYEKLKHGDIQLNKKEVHIHHVVSTVIEVVKYLSYGKAIIIINAIPEDMPLIDADEDRFTQIIYNLMGNAIKFTEEGSITLTARIKMSQIEVSIADTGIGIPMDRLNDIFNSFEQLDASLTKQPVGTGLGLSITKHLVELHGGAIGVTSAPGQGSVFSFTMPISAPSERVSMNRSGKTTSSKTQTSAIQLSSPMTNPDKSEFTVLIVDDDYINLRSIASILAAENYTALTATTGTEALQIIADTRSVDLVILDIMLPHISGYEICHKIRENYSLFELPVLLMTAQNASASMLAGFSAGANDFLSKPFDSNEFKARVKTLLYLKRSVNQTIQAEMAFLQAQIKPHFLYNALNTIISFCWTDPEKAGQLLFALSNYLRGTFNFKNMNPFVTLEEELEFLQSYIALEKARFEEKLTVTMDISIPLNVMIPTLLIQPLVENAIKHGILPLPNGGTVNLSIGQQHNELIITIADNGVGIPPEKLRDITNDTITGSVGLTNINRRLKRIYGHGIDVTSHLSEGTVVTVRVPMKIKEDDAHAQNHPRR